MSLYLHMKTKGVTTVAEVAANFDVEHRVLLPIPVHERDFYADLLTRIHMEVNRAETSFEVRNGRDEIFVGVAKVESYRGAPKIYLSNPVQLSVPPVDEKTRASVIRSAIRGVFESANDVLKGKVQPSLIYETQKK